MISIYKFEKIFENEILIIKIIPIPTEEFPSEN